MQFGTSNLGGKKLLITIQEHHVIQPPRKVSVRLPIELYQALL